MVEIGTLIKESVVYRHILKSRDHDNFSDVDNQQWDSLTGNVYALLRRNGKKFITQAQLLALTKTAAKQLLIEENKYKGKQLL